MLRRFSTWMYTYRRGFALAILAAGLLALLLRTPVGHGGFRGIEMSFWQSQAQACGTLSHRDGRFSGDAQAATTCFMRAYAHCQAATLVDSAASMDVTVTDTFVIEPVLLVGGAHPCSIQYNQFFVVSAVTRLSDYDWVTCTGGVEQRADGLHFSGCGQGNDFVVSSP